MNIGFQFIKQKFKKSNNSRYDKHKRNNKINWGLYYQETNRQILLCYILMEIKMIF